MKKLKQIMITIALTFFVSNGIFAQTTQASISGVVFGSNSAPIKDAIIKIHNESTGFKVSSLSNFKGVFTFKELPLGGPYTISITATGYGDQQKSGYSLNQGDLINIDVSAATCILFKLSIPKFKSMLLECKFLFMPQR